MSRSSRRGPWLPEEDNALVELVRTQGPNNWVRISQQLQYRSPKQCRERYHQNLKPSLNHEPISTQEGEMIEQLVNDMGKRWAEIARRLGNRSDNAVKNWWNGSMNRRKRNPTHGNHPKHIGNGVHPVHGGRGFLQGAAMYGISANKPQCVQIPYTRPESEFTARRVDVLPSPVPELEHTIVRSSVQLQPSPTERYFASYQQQKSVPRDEYFTSYRDESQVTRLAPLRLPSISNPASEAYLTMERPSVSPAISDFSTSHLTRQPPSLISDTQSSCSISPKTMASPRLNGPSYWLPLDGRESCGSAKQQQTTEHNVRYEDAHSLQRYSHTMSSKSDIRQCLHRDDNFRQTTVKDSRMNVLSLLK